MPRHDLRMTISPTRLDIQEHAMRISGDEGLVALLDHAFQDAPAASAMVGRILVRSGSSLPPATPISCLLTGASLDPQWRRVCPVQPGSLMAQLEQLRLLTGGVVRVDDLLAEWLERSALFNSELL